ncbi:MAG: SGNH/GDSL hydrolase family protein [Oscillospiraceae bacterium]
MFPRKRTASILALVLLIIIVILSMDIFINEKPLDNSMAQSISFSSSSELSSNNSNIYHTVDAKYNKDWYSSSLKSFQDILLPYNSEKDTTYLSDTLFVGDSNTAGLSSFGYLPLQNVLGRRSMAIQSVASKEFVWFSGYENPVTIIKAVSLLKPRRIIINFGTNNTVGTSVQDFADIYQSVLALIKSAYPHCDIIVAEVLPVGKLRENRHIKMQTIDEFNLALAKLCAQDGYKLLNFSEAFKDPNTGFMKPKYVSNDGVHLNSEGYETLLRYVCDHKLTVPDRRPPRGFVPKQVDGKPQHSATPEYVAEPGEEVVFPPSLDSSSPVQSAPDTSSETHDSSSTASDTPSSALNSGTDVSVQNATKDGSVPQQSSSDKSVILDPF